MSSRAFRRFPGGKPCGWSPPHPVLRTDPLPPSGGEVNLVCLTTAAIARAWARFVTKLAPMGPPVLTGGRAEGGWTLRQGPLEGNGGHMSCAFPTPLPAFPFGLTEGSI